MLFKVVSIIIALAALAVFLVRALRGEAAAQGRLARRSAGGPGAAPTELVACPRCGAYRPAGSLCRCRSTPTP